MISAFLLRPGHGSGSVSPTALSALAATWMLKRVQHDDEGDGEQI